MLDFDTTFMRKFITFNKQINIYLNHFPKSEKYALSQSIRVDLYKVFDLIIEGQKRYHKKTTLTDLDISFDRLKAKLLLAYHLGYFSFKDGKTDDKNPMTIAEKRYSTISLMASELGKFIGSWIKKIKEENKW
ncbi:four helix bundle protein [Aliarcobacter butzleri]|uniref:four helix bundle protein n=1 Tax=Aliarcobacter TaxID=2321111 RepID=UPI0021B66358|nr:MULTISPECIES: four helix bundle protein [Aliarcobacter]MCT7499500.1 four helix bundle protein [Aliarcobacter cryaerophilus]MCT7613756.1 four helix bundle protein [Aliarcobacter butzleri]